jgi:hypothetical protein
MSEIDEREPAVGPQQQDLVGQLNHVQARPEAWGKPQEEREVGRLGRPSRCPGTGPSRRPPGRPSAAPGKPARSTRPPPALVELGEKPPRPEVGFEDSTHLREGHCERLVTQRSQLPLDVGGAHARERCPGRSPTSSRPASRPRPSCCRGPRRFDRRRPASDVRTRGPGFFGAADRARLGGDLASRLTYGKAADPARPGDQRRRDFVRHSTALVQVAQ